MMQIPLTTPRPLLDALINAAQTYDATPAELQQQSISFIFGNLPANSLMTRADVEKIVYERRGNLTELNETIKRLTCALTEACEALHAILPMAEQAVTKVPHDGSCGPWESCDADCMAAYYDSKAIATARAILKEHQT